ncbi:MAG: Fe-S protein assembly co-chaperone HscB [Neisseriaceae bacterium]|nr:Fe-S protein assembly co-chaperone HscB [Neisseriaceae bacterium]
MTQNHFGLFGLPTAFDIDTAALSATYLALAAACHPDKFAGASAFEQKQSLMMASTVNEAYRTLQQPLDRASYLLSLHHIDADDPMHTQFEPEFLMQQMSWRESLEDAQQAQDLPGLLALADEVQDELSTLLTTLSTTFAQEDYAAAATLVRQGRFMDKLTQNIHQTLDALD